jgi:hypothetical protein
MRVSEHAVHQMPCALLQATLSTQCVQNVMLCTCIVPNIIFILLINNDEQVDLDFAEENDQRVQLIVHSLKPPFLTSGKNGTKAAFGIKQKVNKLVLLRSI